MLPMPSWHLPLFRVHPHLFWFFLPNAEHSAIFIRSKILDTVSPDFFTLPEFLCLRSSGKLCRLVIVSSYTVFNLAQCYVEEFSPVLVTLTKQLYSKTNNML